MKSFEITINDSNQRVDRFVKKICPSLPDSLLQRYIRIKRIKVNGKRCENSQKLLVGDILDAYINDEFFESKKEEFKYDFLHAGKDLTIVYEDENLLLLDKPKGLSAHLDKTGFADTLITRAERYLYEKKEYNPKNENSFTPALCNRIDRNTQGIVIVAKNAQTLRVVDELIRERLIDKKYICIVHGKVTPNIGTLTNYLLKDEEKNMVKVYDKPHQDAKTAITHYKVINSKQNFSLLDISLETGRTHQIRAQMAHFKHPLVGDNKYGTLKNNKKTGFKSQILMSYSLKFNGSPKSEHLSYLDGKEFKINTYPILNIFDKLV